MPTDVLEVMDHVAHVILIFLVIIVLVVLRTMMSRQARDRRKVIADLSERADALALIAKELQASEQKKAEGIKDIASDLAETKFKK